MRISNVPNPVKNKNETSFNNGFPDGVQGELLRGITDKAKLGFKFRIDTMQTYISGH